MRTEPEDENPGDETSARTGSLEAPPTEPVNSTAAAAESELSDRQAGRQPTEAPPTEPVNSCQREHAGKQDDTRKILTLH